MTKLSQVFSILMKFVFSEITPGDGEVEIENEQNETTITRIAANKSRYACLFLFRSSYYLSEW